MPAKLHVIFDECHQLVSQTADGGGVGGSVRQVDDLSVREVVQRLVAVVVQLLLVRDGLQVRQLQSSVVVEIGSVAEFCEGYCNI